MDEDTLTISPPLYMVGKKIACWRCNALMPVIALLAPKVHDIDDVCILSQIEQMPGSMLSYIQGRVPTFLLRHSKTSKLNYFANTCPKCKVIFGDFFLGDEPGAPFFPVEDEQARRLYITEIPLNEPVELKCAVSLGCGEIILKNAKRI